jgi:hypothetical protein
VKTYVVYQKSTGAILRRVICHDSQGAAQVADSATEAIMEALPDARDTTHRVANGQVVAIQAPKSAPVAPVPPPCTSVA